MKKTNPRSFLKLIGSRRLPGQERDLRRPRALPYELHAGAIVQAANGSVRIDFANTGEAAAVFQVRSGHPAHNPRTYTVDPGKQLSGEWAVESLGATEYDLSVYGPNGFLREFKGSIVPDEVRLDVQTDCARKKNQIALGFSNYGPQSLTISVLDRYNGATVSEVLETGRSTSRQWALRRFDGWYHLVVAVAHHPGFWSELAGHLETGEDITSDPLMGGLV